MPSPTTRRHDSADPAAPRPRSATRPGPRRSPAGDRPDEDEAVCANSQRNVSRWPAAAGSAIGTDRTVVRPSRSWADAVGPAGAPVTSALRPGGNAVDAGASRRPERVPAGLRAGPARRRPAPCRSRPGSPSSPGPPRGRHRRRRSGHRGRRRPGSRAGTRRARRARGRPPCCGRSRSRSGCPSGSRRWTARSCTRRSGRCRTRSRGSSRR